MPISSHFFRYDSVGLKSDITASKWEAYNTEPHSIRPGSFDICPILANIFTIRFDCERETSFPMFAAFFDIRSKTPTIQIGSFDIFSSLPHANRRSNRFDVKRSKRDQQYSHFDIIIENRIQSTAISKCLLDVNSLAKSVWTNYFNAISTISIPCNAAFCYKFDVFPQASCCFLSGIFDRIGLDRPASPYYGVSGLFEVPLTKQFCCSGRFDSFIDFCNCDLRKGNFEVCVYVQCTDGFSGLFNIYDRLQLASHNSYFDIIRSNCINLASHRQAFVMPGWSIIAKNIESDLVIPVGWIDEESDSRSIENVSLPDGDYEITVLTSKLFWKDAREHVVRTISIRSGQEISALPTIYNLRSSVSQGETTVRWSANRSEVSDCVFGVWRSETSPVLADTPPHDTVWYSQDLTEFQTNVTQSGPMYVAIAAIRTGNEEETGPVHELFLPWSNTKPRSPDDAVVLREPLPLFDSAIPDLHADEPDMQLWQYL